jgi:uncharacterized repeat protein (TIGR03943 family)
VTGAAVTGAVVRRTLHGLILALVGGTLLKLAITGDYTRYVKPGVRPYLIAASIMALAIAAATLWQALRGRRAAIDPADDHADAGGDHAGADDHGPADDDGHGHAHGTGRFDIAWLLVAPMLVLLLIAPPALGSYSAARAGTALGAASTSNLPPLPDGDPVRVSVLEYASRAVFDHGRSLTGRHITLSGFVSPGDAGRWYLTRMVITCCAADAQPIKVGLSGTVPTGLSANQWLEVTGSYTDQRDLDPVNQQAIPYLTVESSRPIPAPARQYE